MIGIIVALCAVIIIIGIFLNGGLNMKCPKCGSKYVDSRYMVEVHHKEEGEYGS